MTFHAGLTVASIRRWNEPSCAGKRGYRLKTPRTRTELSFSRHKKFISSEIAHELRPPCFSTMIRGFESKTNRPLIAPTRITGDWQPLADLVRLPALSDIKCPSAPELACKLSGSNLFLIDLAFLAAVRWSR